MCKKRLLKFVLVGLIAFLLVSCGGESTTEAEPTEAPQPTVESVPTQPAEPPATEPAQEPEPVAGGGDLVFGLYQEISDSLDPHVTNATVNGIVYFHLLDPLIWKTEDGFLPGLAESWEISPDATEYTFHLRQDVVFHDGTPFNAEAVKVNFDRIVDPETQSRIALGFMGSYEATEVVDEYTVRVKFSSPFAPFLDSVSQPFLGIVSPAAIEEWGAEVGMHLAGTGPFMLDEYVPGERVAVVRNPNYQWGPEIFGHQGPPLLDSITFIMLPEDLARSSALETGEVQAIERAPAADVPRLQDQGKEVAVLLQPGMPISLMMNTENPPLDDVTVRHALLYAVDQQELVDTLFPGIHEAADGPASRPTWGYNPAVEDMYPNDPAEAQALLEEAGWVLGDDGIRVKDGEPLNLELIFLTGTGFDETWQLVQAQLREVGVDVTLSGMAASAALEKASAGDFNLMHLRWTFSDPDTMNVMWHSKNLGGGTGFNFSKVQNERIDELLDQAAAEQDLQKRREMYAEVQEIIMENAYLIPIYDEGNAVAIDGTVTGIHFDPRGRFPLLHEASIG